MLHTINGERVSDYQCRELILCLAFSTLPEGRAVNVLVGGLSNGTIRIWSSWDLIPVRDILSPKFTYPIVRCVIYLCLHCHSSITVMYRLCHYRVCPL